VRPNLPGLIDELALTWQEIDQRSDALATALGALSRDDEIVSEGENLADYEVPRQIALLDELPRQHWQDPSS
jgi:hypothetical protein